MKDEKIKNKHCFCSKHIYLKVYSSPKTMIKLQFIMYTIPHIRHFSTTKYNLLKLGTLKMVAIGSMFCVLVSNYFVHRTKIKKLFVSRIRYDSKYFLAWFATIFFLGVTENRDQKFQYLRSELVYTFKWTKSVARLWRNQICEWTQSILKKKKKIPLPTDP